MTWHNPIPYKLIPTTDRDLKVKEDETHLPLPKHPGAYGVKRKHHTHEGVDLYVKYGTPVFAVEDGVIVADFIFTGARAQPPSPWWKETEAIMIEGASGVVLYGEIYPSGYHRVGDKVKAGEVVGNVTQVLTQNKGYPMCMLHLELHVPGTRYAYDWVDEKPPSLMDPTRYLLDLVE